MPMESRQKSDLEIYQKILGEENTPYAQDLALSL